MFVEKEVARLLELEICYHQQVEVIKHDLVRRFDWNVATAFAAIDTMHHGSIGIESVLAFCRHNGFHAHHRDATAIIRRLDIDADNVINFEEFAEAMAPQ